MVVRLSEVALSSPQMQLVRISILRKWLLGLFLAAQVIGFFPLTHHDLGDETAAALGYVHGHFASDTSRQNADHHHGFVNDQDQCCRLCALSATLPPPVSLVLAETVAILQTPPQPKVVISLPSSRLDRPPKDQPLA
jgi:hypothetical protein